MGYEANMSLEDFFDERPLEFGLRRAAERAQERLLELVRKYTPVDESPGARERGRDPGTLRDSWSEGEVELMRDGAVRVTVETHRPEAPHVEYPTRPHLIRPRADRAPASVLATGQPRGSEEEDTPQAALRFYLGGRVVYAAEVMHPGTQGSFMLHKAVAQLERELPVIMRDAVAYAYSRRGRAEVGA